MKKWNAFWIASLICLSSAQASQCVDYFLIRPFAIEEFVKRNVQVKKSTAPALASPETQIDVNLEHRIQRWEAAFRQKHAKLTPYMHTLSEINLYASHLIAQHENTLFLQLVSRITFPINVYRANPFLMEGMFEFHYLLKTAILHKNFEILPLLERLVPDFGFPESEHPRLSFWNYELAKAVQDTPPELMPFIKSLRFERGRAYSPEMTESATQLTPQKYARIQDFLKAPTVQGAQNLLASLLPRHSILNAQTTEKGKSELIVELQVEQGGPHHGEIMSLGLRVLDPRYQQKIAQMTRYTLSTAFQTLTRVYDGEKAILGTSIPFNDSEITKATYKNNELIIQIKKGKLSRAYHSSSTYQEIHLKYDESQRLRSITFHNSNYQLAGWSTQTVVLPDLLRLRLHPSQLQHFNGIAETQRPR